MINTLARVVQIITECGKSVFTVLLISRATGVILR